jgi:hypothetical protein
MALPVLGYKLVDTTAAQEIDLSVACGKVYLINKGPDIVYIAFSGVVASAALGSGKKQLALNESYAVTGSAIQKVYARTASGTASLEVLGTPS